jgi:tagaturonate epimerase
MEERQKLKMIEMITDSIIHQKLFEWFHGKIFKTSIQVESGSVYCLGVEGKEKRLIVLSEFPDGPEKFLGKQTNFSLENRTYSLKSCPVTAFNARELRKQLINLQPVPIGLQPSFGFGDRLGLATPGHVASVKNSQFTPLFAQQSIREMNRMNRTPQRVMDDATWGAFQAGWRTKLGADADHLKTLADAELCLAAGFCFFTIDPGESISQSAETGDLLFRVNALPWAELDSNFSSIKKVYSNSKVDLTSYSTVIDQEQVLRFFSTYGSALVQIVRNYRFLSERLGEGSFDFEVSIDETDLPTKPRDHYLLAKELRRLGIKVTSLAPRFSGRFEKGVDFIGDLKALSSEMRQHAEIAQSEGPYKISLHSGSDKFSIYPIAAEFCKNLIHVKTAGTSYLEAMRTIAIVEPHLFREILQYSTKRYEIDRKSYHVSADETLIKDTRKMTNNELPELLDDFIVRQVLHVTFGSVMTEKNETDDLVYGSKILELLTDNEPIYQDLLERHFKRHLTPFLEKSIT